MYFSLQGPNPAQHPHHHLSSANNENSQPSSAVTSQRNSKLDADADLGDQSLSSLDHDVSDPASAGAQPPNKKSRASVTSLSSTAAAAQAAAASLDSKSDIDESDPPEVKAEKEKVRRQANNARER